MEKLELILHEVYGAPEDRLGNQVDPLDEAIYIILSIQTGLARFIETWRNLRAIFPSWSQVEEASVDAISDVLRSGGLHRQKAIAIQRLLRRVRNRFGTLSLDALYGMADSDAERFLLGLPGISWKTGMDLRRARRAAYSSP